MEPPRLLRRGDKEVVIFTTPSGVRAIVDTSISDDALRLLAQKLRRKIRDRERRALDRALAAR